MKQPRTTPKQLKRLGWEITPAIALVKGSFYYADKTINGIRILVQTEGFPYLKIGHVLIPSLSPQKVDWNDFDAATRLRAMLSTKSLLPVWEQLIAEIPQIDFEVKMIEATAKKHDLIVDKTGHITSIGHRNV